MARAIQLAAAFVLIVVVGGVLLIVVIIGDAKGAGCDGGRLVHYAGARDLDSDQMNTVRVILSVAAGRHLPERAATIAVATSLTETELHNVNYGDRDSLGIFQQRPSTGWGTPDQIMDPVYAAGKFFEALVKVPHWQSRSLGDVAQTVQRSGHPERYAPREFQAQGLVRDVSQQIGQLPDPCVRQTVNRPGAIDRALSQIGKPYCWAGGGTNGPTPGDGSSPPPCGQTQPGFDCSGLMVYAFAPYTVLPRTSRAQYTAPGTVQVPVNQAVPGDLLFWASNTGNAATIHHVALVVAPGELVEAPHDGASVQRRHYSVVSKELMPKAVRVTR